MTSLRMILGSAALLILPAVAMGEDAKDKLPPASEGKAWKLAWHDEFDGPTLDTNKWIYWGEGKHRDGWWSREAVALDGNGHLIIKTFREGDKVIDGCITTQGKFEHRFGYFVARVQFQKQPGHWPAFWMMCKGVFQVGDEGRDGTEIDIMEKPWLDQRVQHTFHWDGYKEHHKTAGYIAKVPDVMSGWHTFGVLWLPDHYVFYIDGRESWSSTAGGVSQVPEYLLLSDEVGPWAGEIAKAALPDAFLVDYVRVYDLVERK